MEEIEKLTIELLDELDGMSLETIEGLRVEFIAGINQKVPEKWKKVKKYINALCDVAIDRAKKRLEVA